MNSALPHVATLFPHPNQNLSMGHLLLESGKISADDIEQVLRIQKEQGKRFGEVAESLGLVTQNDIQHALARQFSYPYLQPGDGQYASELVAAYQPFSAEVEGYRALRSQLMLRWFSTGRKSLVIVSIDSHNGTSVLIANLGVLFAQLGVPTLIVDANLRQPRQHQIFKLQKRQGLSDVLARRAGLETISDVEAFSDLSVLGSGTVPPNPLELVSRPSFADLTEGLSSRFDIILIDAPAFLVGADALAIASHVGGVLLVAARDKTRLEDVGRIGDQLTRVGVEVVGSVLVDSNA